MIRIAVVFWASALLAAAPAPPPQTSRVADPTPDQWREDVRFLAKELPQRHKNAFHTLPRAEFERRVNELLESIPHMSQVEIRAAITRLVAAIGDGHTHASLRSDRIFDPQFRHFPEGLFVTAAAKDYGQAIGARVVSINGTPVAEVRKRLAAFVSKENEFAIEQYANWVSSAAAMQAAGIIHSMDQAEFALEKQPRSLGITVTSRFANRPHPEWVWQPVERPMYLQDARTAYWWKYVPGSKTLYIQYNSCEEMQGLPFQKFTDQIVEQVAREAPAKIVIDLRHNRGGNSEVLNPLLRAMRENKALHPRGGIYVLIGPHTFSSGLIAAVRLAKLHATLAGEPVAERPNGYGEMRWFNLPNSGIQVTYSSKSFAEVPGDPPALMPDLPVPITAADYFAGRDPVLEAVLKR